MDSTLPSSAAVFPNSLARWTGRVLTGVSVAFLTFDAAIKLIDHPEVAKAFAPLGIPSSLTLAIGLLLAGCLALYVVPRTAPLGAALLTGYLGGAVFAHLRVGNPLLTHTLFPVFLGTMLWAGLFLRDRRVRRLLAAPKETP